MGARGVKGTEDMQIVCVHLSLVPSSVIIGKVKRIDRYMGAHIHKNCAYPWAVNSTDHGQIMFGWEEEIGAPASVLVCMPDHNSLFIHAWTGQVVFRAARSDTCPFFPVLRCCLRSHLDVSIVCCMPSRHQKLSCARLLEGV
eukprot:1146849-Pelagomonas_calceolata.AAC.4